MENNDQTIKEYIDIMEAIENIEWLKSFVKEFRHYRSKNKIHPGKKLSVAVLANNNLIVDKIKMFTREICHMCKLSSIITVGFAPQEYETEIKILESTVFILY